LAGRITSDADAALGVSGLKQVRSGFRRKTRFDSTLFPAGDSLSGGTPSAFIGRSVREVTERVMSASSGPLFKAEGTSPDVGCVCDAMFLAGARALGLGLDAEIPPAAQEKIIEAASMLVAGLRHIAWMTTNGGERELGN
jgi:hypothetical protein